MDEAQSLRAKGASWQVVVTAPDGTSDHGSVTLLSVTMSPQELAHRIADIAWRITHDLADIMNTKHAGEPIPGELVREKVVE